MRYYKLEDKWLLARGFCVGVAVSREGTLVSWGGMFFLKAVLLVSIVLGL